MDGTLDHLKRNSHAITFVYSIDGKFIWPKVAKTGGTSIQGRLNNSYGDIVHDTHRQALFFNELDDDKLDRYFKFTFVRNPWDRVLSLYHVFKNRLHITFEEFVFDYLTRLSVELDKDSFDRLSGVENSLHRHCLCQHISFHNGEENYVDFIGRFETLEDDLNLIKKELNVDGGLPHLNRSKKRKLPKDYYSDETVLAVSNLYKKDIDLLGYKFEERV